jgi:peptidoglycan/xylan/chitin deacetylase (PgdA/CDA1 family)
MRSVTAFTYLVASCIAMSPAAAGECPGNPNAIGTHRTIVVDPSEHTLLGGAQYTETLPLNDKEVVLTFDDGPLPPYSTRVLDILARECVKATYFMVGKMVGNFPKVVRRTHEEGHTVANHSQNHSYNIHRQPIVDGWKEIEDGFESLRAALGDPSKVAPFFRFPGLLRDDSVERFLAARSIMSWSVDVISDDSSRISSWEIIRRTLHRLEAKGKGIILLHDIQPATANALPQLLSELKARGYRIVHVVPTGPGRVKTPTTPEQWAVARPPRPDHGIWNNAVASRAIAVDPVLDVPSPQSFGADEITGSVVRVQVPSVVQVALAHGGEAALPVMTLWPDDVSDVDVAEASEFLPAPAIENFRYVRLGKQRSAKQIRAALGKKKHETVTTNGQTNGGAAPKADHASAEAKAKHTAAKDWNKKDWNKNAKDWNKNAKANSNKSGGKTKRTGATGHQIQLPKPQASLAPTP